MRFVDATTGEALARTKLVVVQVGQRYLSAKDWETDAAGALRLALPAGESFHVCRRDEVRRRGTSAVGFYDEATIVERLRSEPADLVWTAAGPSAPVVRVPRLR